MQYSQGIQTKKNFVIDGGFEDYNVCEFFLLYWRILRRNYLTASGNGAGLLGFADGSDLCRETLKPADSHGIEVLPGQAMHTK